MENSLNEQQGRYRVIENCLNGRRTVWEDPFKPGRNGLLGIGQVIEMNSPLELVILLLGTNDFQSMHAHNPWHSAQGIRSLITAIRYAPVEPDMPIPAILLVAPPVINTPKGSMAPKFQGAEEKCQGLAAEYRQAAEELNCAFFDSATVISSSEVDGVHLDRDQHRILGKTLAGRVLELLE